MTTKLEEAAREVIRQHSMECLSDKAVGSLREALAEQAEQEPILLSPSCAERGCACFDDRVDGEPVTAYLASVQPVKQEPVAIGSEWRPCMKLPVVVHVREQREGESHVSTREGITPVRPDDLIMRGVAGEEYPIGRELFNKTYTFDTAAPVRTKDLTDDEIAAVTGYRKSGATWPVVEEVARAVIAADREKNK